MFEEHSTNQGEYSKNESWKCKNSGANDVCKIIDDVPEDNQQLAYTGCNPILACNSVADEREESGARAKLDSVISKLPKEISGWDRS